jgi:menaquinone-dependent protoporphyrinogen oxidase
MTVLVGYVSRRGATRGVAERITARLRGSGRDVDLRALRGDEDPAAYEAVVVGSPVYAGQWGTELVRFLCRHADTLRERPVWTFTVGRLARQRGLLRLMAWPDADHLEEFHRMVPVRGHAFLAGAIDPARLTWAERWAFRVVGGRYGDFRDWAAIDRWADGIARELTARTPAA